MFHWPISFCIRFTFWVGFWIVCITSLGIFSPLHGKYNRTPSPILGCSGITSSSNGLVNTQWGKKKKKHEAKELLWIHMKYFLIHYLHGLNKWDYNHVPKRAIIYHWLCSRTSKLAPHLWALLLEQSIKFCKMCTSEMSFATFALKVSSQILYQEHQCHLFLKNKST